MFASFVTFGSIGYTVCMGRSRNFTREQVLDKAMLVFWKNGFAETSVHDLEAATGVNKSGLYSEFTGKEDLYTASLAHYLSSRGKIDWLTQEPLGWSNIEKFLQQAERSRDIRGCFMIYAIRELHVLSENAHKILLEHYVELRTKILENVRAVRPKADPELLTDMIMPLFSGLVLMQNHRKRTESSSVSLSDFMNLLKQL